MTNFQKILSISLLIAVLSLAYYLVIFLPRKEEAKHQLEIQRLSNLNLCIQQSQANANNRWNADCEANDLGDGCSLDYQHAKYHRDTAEQEINMCYKTYPPQ